MTRKLLLLPAVLLVFACQEADHLLAPSGPEAAFAISDGAHGGAAGFYFLPPMVAAPAFTGTFDASAAPEVVICQWHAGVCVVGGYHATFTLSSTPAVVLHAGGENYSLRWETRGLGLAVGDVYRVRVRQDGSELGFADVQIVANSRDLRTVPAANVGLVEDRTLQVKFRIESAATPERIVYFTEYLGGNEIWVTNADGTNPTRLTQEPVSRYPSWSPDGTRIAFVSRRGDDVWDQIYVMNADGTSPVRLTNEHSNRYPAWSPDGTKIAFVSWRDGDTEIYVMNTDGTGQTRLTYNVSSGYSLNDMSPSWSPDGTKIVFMSDRSGIPGVADHEIWVMNANGDNLTRLTDIDYASNPRWSPDGTKIAFDTWLPGNDPVYVMNADGTGLTQLTPTTSDNVYPAWSPDGTKIAFSSNRDGDYHIWIMNADGSNAVRLEGTPDHVFEPDWTR